MWYWTLPKCDMCSARMHTHARARTHIHTHTHTHTHNMFDRPGVCSLIFLLLCISVFVNRMVKLLCLYRCLLTRIGSTWAHLILTVQTGCGMFVLHQCESSVTWHLLCGMENCILWLWQKLQRERSFFIGWMTQPPVGPRRKWRRQVGH